jgi:hypothetical protein
MSKSGNDSTWEGVECEVTGEADVKTEVEVGMIMEMARG